MLKVVSLTAIAAWTSIDIWQADVPVIHRVEGIDVDIFRCECIHDLLTQDTPNVLDVQHAGHVMTEIAQAVFVNALSTEERTIDNVKHTLTAWLL